jgi:hypothetical protein
VATPADLICFLFNPEGVAAVTVAFDQREPQPLRGWLARESFPKVAEYRNLGLRAAIPLGLPPPLRLPLTVGIAATLAIAFDRWDCR